jgi:hypothetical protein
MHFQPTRRSLIKATPGLLLPSALANTALAAPNDMPSDPTSGRNLVFDESFTKLDQSVWHAGPKATTAAQGHYGRAAFSRFGGEEGFDPYAIIDDPQASDGKALQITAKYMGRSMTITNYYGNNLPEFQWISGNIQTAKPDGTVNKGWRTGYFEASMWFPKHPLTWPAFWLLNEKSILRPATSIEIDIVEHKGWELDQYGAYLHEWGKPDERHDGTGVFPGVDLTKGYHRYGILIDGPRCALYFDRKPVLSPQTGLPTVWTIGRAALLDAQGDVFWPLLSLALRTDVPFPQPLRPEDHLAHLRIDHFRVYQ